ncbi:MAG: hypothetical protein AAGD86_02010 [Pseudomonadota bacterium]
MNVNLAQFASLFEIGFALHLAVAFLERMYARELPVRIEQIAARINALERFKRELLEGAQQRDASGKANALKLPYRTLENPVWVRYNDGLLDQLYTLGHESTGKLSALRSILSSVTFMAVLVALYSVTALFLIGLEFEFVKQMRPMTASLIVLAQLLPLPLAAALFLFVARRMSRNVDRQLRGIGEKRLLLSDADSTASASYAMVEEIYRRDLERRGAFEDQGWRSVP